MLRFNVLKKSRLVLKIPPTLGTTSVRRTQRIRHWSHFLNSTAFLDVARQSDPAMQRWEERVLLNWTAAQGFPRRPVSCTSMELMLRTGTTVPFRLTCRLKQRTQKIIFIPVQSASDRLAAYRRLVRDSMIDATSLAALISMDL